MCGILIYSSNLAETEDIQQFRSAIAARGPDHYGSVNSDELVFESSVLSLRTPFTPQPIEDEGSVFCYNGQIYDLPEGHEQDTAYAFRLVHSSFIAELMAAEGEFAFAHYSDRTITFGRDVHGRRSLLYHLDESGDIIISSVGTDNDHYNFVECDGAGVIYKYRLDTRTVERIQVPVPEFWVNYQIANIPNPSLGVLASLKAAVARRTIRPKQEENLAVMFSGGLDCTLIAAILDDLLPDHARIHLLNVAFENKRTGSLWDTPDRILAQRSLAELVARSQHPQRFQLVEINVPYSTAQQHKSNVQRLMAPNATVMDLSIALAFYFAAQPQGEHSPKILFSGLGADELFAGYSRHTSAAAIGAQDLAEELTLDFKRLPHRNLGRDDRVCACWGREVRYPFLDKLVVDEAARLPTNYKINGNTTKAVLREVGKALGLSGVTNEKKRAIQFGARSAKMDPGTGRVKGHHSLIA